MDKVTDESAIIGDAIRQAAENVLETMFFTMPYEGPYEGPPDGPYDGPDEEKEEASEDTARSALHASLNFSGEFAGDFSVETPIEAAREIAANFAGAADPGEVTDEKAAEVIAELANMVCGSTLSILHRDRLFDLDAPQVRLAPHMSRQLDHRDAAFDTTRSLDLGNGSRIVFRLRGHA